MVLHHRPQCSECSSTLARCCHTSPEPRAALSALQQPWPSSMWATNCSPARLGAVLRQNWHPKLASARSSGRLARAAGPPVPLCSASGRSQGSEPEDEAPCTTGGAGQAVVGGKERPPQGVRPSSYPPDTRQQLFKEPITCSTVQCFVSLCVHRAPQCG